MQLRTPPPSGDTYDVIGISADHDEPASPPASVPSRAGATVAKASHGNGNGNGHANGRGAEDDDASPYGLAESPGAGGGLFNLNLAEDDAETDTAPSSAPVAGGESAADRKRREAEEAARKAEEEKARKAAEAEALKAQKAEEAAARQAEKQAKRKKRKRKGSAVRTTVPGWLVSLMVHGAILGLLMMASFSSETKNLLAKLNAGLETAVPAEEPMKILADAAKETSDTLANPTMAVTSATPAVNAAKEITEQTSMPEMDAPGLASPLASMPSAPAMDLSGGGMIAGDVTRAVDGIDQALDQLAGEILRHLLQSKVTVVWLFDESSSMKDDQMVIKGKFERIASELFGNVTSDQKQSAALLHAIVGFGSSIHFDVEPTDDYKTITDAIGKLRMDPTGAEKTLEAFARVIARYNSHVTKDRRLLIVLVTDESGDDGQGIEEVRQLCMNKRVPVYVLGRQALFGEDTLHLEYTDPVTKDKYWPTIKRGPETADLEMLQYDGLHGRWDEVPSGFPSYELARLTKDTGGIYFLLPNEEELRVRNRRLERDYWAKGSTTMKEYVPSYESRIEYGLRREKSEFRRTLNAFINASKKFGFDHHFPVDPPRFFAEAKAVQAELTLRRAQMKEMETVLRKIKPLRDREPEKRWQAAYDIMLAQSLAYQIKAYEFSHLLKKMAETKPVPKAKPTKDNIIEWHVEHAKQKYAPTAETDAKYAEAEALFRDVITKHPNTPWADLAQDELNRGFGVHYYEWVGNSRYYERAKLVPKY